MKFALYLFVAPIIFCTFFPLQGCFRHAPVRHLSSDVCLIVPNFTSRQEVMAFLGPPDRSVTQPDNTEVWYYYQGNKSLFRKTPLVGEKLGYENYDVAVITFAGDRVLTCVYRALSEDEFEKSGLAVEEPPVEQ